MNRELYEVHDELGNLVGSYLTRSNALILIDALFARYYNEPKLKFTISKMALETEACNE